MSFLQFLLEFHSIISSTHSKFKWSEAKICHLAAVSAPIIVSLKPLTIRGAVRVTWSPPTDLCGLNNPQYTIQYGRNTSTYTTTFSTPSSSQFDITGLEVGQVYSVRVAVHTQSGSGIFDEKSVTTYEGMCHCM